MAKAKAGAAGVAQGAKSDGCGEEGARNIVCGISQFFLESWNEQPMFHVITPVVPGPVSCWLGKVENFCGLS
jgi:hypothetical protein